MAYGAFPWIDRRAGRDLLSGAASHYLLPRRHTGDLAVISRLLSSGAVSAEAIPNPR
jgi:hypothetical protein